MDDRLRLSTDCGTLLPMSWPAIALAVVLLVPAPPGGSGGSGGGPGQVRAALAVLHGWDATRSAAYAAGQEDRLAALYVPGSTAGAQDVSVLRAYAVHRWRITSLTTQIRSVRVLAHRQGRWRLRTVDRSRGIADTPERCRAVPAGAYRTHDVVLVRRGSRWVVEWVRLRPARSRAPR